MQSHTTEAFLLGTQDDIPAVKLMKYRKFINNNPKQAQEIKAAMLQLAISSKLIGEYEEIFKLFEEPIEKTDKYKQIRAEMVEVDNRLTNQATNYQNNREDEYLAKTNLKIAQLYFSYGSYKEAFNYFKKVYRNGSEFVQPQQYYNQMALATYYAMDYIELTMIARIDLEKKYKDRAIDFFIIQDLKNIHTIPKARNAFINIFQLEFTNIDLMQNKAISLTDLGFIYSLILLAYRPRQNFNKITAWSSKLQNHYLRGNYKKVREIIAQEKSKKCFHPVLETIYKECEQIISFRIFKEVISAFDRCPISLLQKNTGITQGQADMMLKKSMNKVVLKDPVTSSFKYQRDVNELQHQVIKLYEDLNTKYLQSLQKKLSKKILEEDPQVGMPSSFGRRMMSGF